MGTRRSDQAKSGQSEKRAAPIACDQIITVQN
jgi:hypothetical protein